MEVLRRCPLAIAQRLVHGAIAVSTAVLGQSHNETPVLLACYIPAVLCCTGACIASSGVLRAEYTGAVEAGSGACPPATRRAVAAQDDNQITGFFFFFFSFSFFFFFFFFFFFCFFFFFFFQGALRPQKA